MYETETNCSEIENCELEECKTKYEQLVQMTHLSEEDANCMGAILERAIEDAELSNAIAAIDRRQSVSRGLLAGEHLESYRNQQALLREQLGQATIPQKPPSPDVLAASSLI